MKKYFCLLISIFLIGSTLHASDDLLTPKKMQVFATSISSFLQLQDYPPTDGSTAIPITADLEANVLNLLASHEDYFHLFSPRIGFYIIDTTEQKSDGSFHHCYAPRPGQEKAVLGYLNCLDNTTSDQVAASIADRDGADSYTYYNHVTKTDKTLYINLEMDNLSSKLIQDLYGEYFDTDHQGARDSANYVWIDQRAFAGDQLKKSKIPQNVYTLGLGVSLDNDTSDSGYDYGYSYGQHDPQHNYTS